MMGTCHAMDGHGWAWVNGDGYGLGMGTNLKENVGLYSMRNTRKPLISCFLHYPQNDGFLYQEQSNF